MDIVVKEVVTDFALFFVLIYAALLCHRLMSIKADLLES